MQRTVTEAIVRPLNLTICLKGARNKIYIGKDVIRVLGAPKFVCIKVNETFSSLVIQPGDEKEYMSFKVPEKLFVTHKSEFTINSKRFVGELLRVNGLDPAVNHPLVGAYSEKANSVIFNVTSTERS